MTLSFILLSTSETQELPWDTSVFHTLIATSSADLIIFISSISMATTWALHVVIISDQICWSCLLNTSPYLLLPCSIPFPTQLAEIPPEDVFISKWKCQLGLQDSACLVWTSSWASFVFLALCMLAMWPTFMSSDVLSTYLAQSLCTCHILSLE